MIMKNKYYALYKGDTYIDSGNLIYLANKRNIKLKSLQFLLTPTYKKRCKNSKNRLYLIKIS